MADSKKKDLTWGERMINWAKALSIAGATLVAIYAAALKGEPDAELAFEHLAELSAKHKVETDKALAELNMKIEKGNAFVKGFVEGQQSKSAAPVEQPKGLEKMSRRLEKMAPKVSCRDGFRLEGNHCVPVPEAKPKPAATRPGPTKEALNGSKLDGPIAAAKRNPKAETVKIKTYIAASRKGWTMGEQLAAMKLSKLAQRERWTFEKYVKRLEALHGRLRKSQSGLPRTLKKLKALKRNEEETKAQMHEGGF